MGDHGIKRLFIDAIQASLLQSREILLLLEEYLLHPLTLMFNLT